MFLMMPDEIGFEGKSTALPLLQHPCLPFDGEMSPPVFLFPPDQCLLKQESTARSCVTDFECLHSNREELFVF